MHHHGIPSLPHPTPPKQGRDAEAASGFLDEIVLLQRLAGKPGIIALVDSEVHRGEGLIYMVLECGDIDLARLLQVGPVGGWAGASEGGGVRGHRPRAPAAGGTGGGGEAEGGGVL